MAVCQKLTLLAQGPAFRSLLAVLALVSLLMAVTFFKGTPQLAAASRPPMSSMLLPMPYTCPNPAAASMHTSTLNDELPTELLHTYKSYSEYNILTPRQKLMLHTSLRDGVYLNDSDSGNISYPVPSEMRPPGIPKCPRCVILFWTRRGPFKVCWDRLVKKIRICPNQFPPPAPGCRAVQIPEWASEAVRRMHADDALTDLQRESLVSTPDRPSKRAGVGIVDEHHEVISGYVLWVCPDEKERVQLIGLDKGLAHIGQTHTGLRIQINGSGICDNYRSTIAS